MKAKHTPPPWTVHHFIRDDMTPQDLGLYEIEEVNERFNDMLNDDPNSLGKVIAEANANAARIVACVNACAGIPTADLATGVVPVEVVRRLVEAAGQYVRHIGTSSGSREWFVLRSDASTVGRFDTHEQAYEHCERERAAAIAAAEQAMGGGQ